MNEDPLIKMWTQPESIALCVELESICPAYGCHVALTGGLLYKKGTRKDCDIILYRIRQCEKIDFDGLFAALAGIGIVKVSGFGFCHKAEYNGKKIDFLSPEEDGGYDTEPASIADIFAEIENALKLWRSSQTLTKTRKRLQPSERLARNIG